MSEDTRTILKKLMRDALDEKDRQRLLCDPKVEERMRSQWDEAADRVNPVVGNRMWERIIARTNTFTKKNHSNTFPKSPIPLFSINPPTSNQLQ